MGATGLNTRHRPGPADTLARLTRPENLPGPPVSVNPTTGRDEAR